MPPARDVSSERQAVPCVILLQHKRLPYYEVDAAVGPDLNPISCPGDTPGTVNCYGVRSPLGACYPDLAAVAAALRTEDARRRTVHSLIGQPSPVVVPRTARPGPSVGGEDVPPNWGVL